MTPPPTPAPASLEAAVNAAPATRRLVARLQAAMGDQREGLIVALVAQAQGGDAHAERALLEHHRGFVRGVCRRLRLPREEWDDHLSAGLMGMRASIQRYDPMRGVPLWGYAYRWVRGAIIQERGAQRGLSPHQTKCYRRVRQAWRALVDEGDGAEPDAAAVAAAVRERCGLRVSPATVAPILAVCAQGRTRAIGDARHLERLAYAAVAGAADSDVWFN